MRTQSLWIVLTLLAAPVWTGAQWINHPAPGTPRTRDGKANLTAPAPRANGKPDLSGIWQAESAPIQELMRLLPGAENEKDVSHLVGK